MNRCDICSADKPLAVLDAPGLDGPLVRCSRCGLYYVASRRSQLTFGSDSAEAVAERVRQANQGFHNLRLEEEHRLALLNARWRVDLIRQYCGSGRLLEVGCARGDFLQVAKDFYEVQGVEPNPELAQSARNVAAVHQDVVETLPMNEFDIAASFHVIEHVDSPARFVRAMAQRVKAGGWLILETPNIDSLPFKTMRSRWRQFIPEHYYFFDPRTITRLLESDGLKVEGIQNVGKYASIDLILNRLSRYTAAARPMEYLCRTLHLSRLTFRINPMDIMFVVARKLPNSAEHR